MILRKMMDANEYLGVKQTYTLIPGTSSYTPNTVR